MKLSEFVIAILFVVAAGISTFALVATMYSPEGYDIDLTDDAHTQHISSMQDKFATAKTDTGDTTQQVFNGSVGQPGAEIKAGDLTEGDLIAAAGRAVRNIPSYLSTFFVLMYGMFNAVGLGSIPAVWWITTALIIMVALMLLGIFVKQQL